MSTKTLATKYESLPEALQKEVADFLDFVIATKMQKQKSSKKKNGFTFNWAGGLKDLKQQYTSVELQHKLNDYR